MHLYCVDASSKELMRTSLDFSEMEEQQQIQSSAVYSADLDRTIASLQNRLKEQEAALQEVCIDMLIPALVS